jgi:hypothetical protein
MYKAHDIGLLALGWNSKPIGSQPPQHDPSSSQPQGPENRPTGLRLNLSLLIMILNQSRCYCFLSKP